MSFKKHPLWIGFAQKDKKQNDIDKKVHSFYEGNICELCDKMGKSERRADNIYVCNECNIKHPVPEGINFNDNR